MNNKLSFYFIHKNLTRTYQPVPIEERKDLEKGEPLLCRNYPSPFSDGTVFQIISKIPLNTELKIYNLIGQEVWSREIEDFGGGKRELEWNGKDRKGKNLPSGMYLYVVEGTDREGKKYVSKGKTLKLK